jgi:hypothetical protein
MSTYAHPAQVPIEASVSEVEGGLQVLRQHASWPWSLVAHYLPWLHKATSLTAPLTCDPAHDGQLGAAAGVGPAPGAHARLAVLEALRVVARHAALRPAGRHCLAR